MQSGNVKEDIKIQWKDNIAIMRFAINQNTK